MFPFSYLPSFFRPRWFYPGFLTPSIGLGDVHSPADVLRHWVTQNGLGVMGGQPGEWPCFCSIEPNSPDDVLTFTDTTSRQFGASQYSGEGFDHPGVQIRIRSGSYIKGYRKAHELKTFLDQVVYLSSVIVEGSEYLIQAISRSSDIISIGQDAPSSATRQFSLNMTMSITVK